MSKSIFVPVYTSISVPGLPQDSVVGRILCHVHLALQYCYLFALCQTVLIFMTLLPMSASADNTSKLFYCIQTCIHDIKASATANTPIEDRTHAGHFRKDEASRQNSCLCCNRQCLDSI